MKIEPIAFLWTGREMVPLDRFRALANRQFRAGQEYALIPHQARSSESHRHFFSCVRKGWDNLPERIANQYPTSEHLRKWALVQEGYADEKKHVCASANEARKLAALIRTLDGYAVMKIQGSVLMIWTPMSQDENHMGHETFEKSKTVVLERIAHMCGITVKELTANAKENA